MHPQISELYDDYLNGFINRREFLKKLAVLTGGAASAQTLLPLLKNNNACAQTIQQNALDLHTEYINYPGETGDIRAYLARPEGEEKLPTVIVIHENKGLQPHIEDVTRRVALEQFLAIAPDALSPLGGTPDDPNKAQSLIGQLDEQATIKNFAAAVQYLKTAPLSTGKVGCMGFCWGGGLTNQVAVHSPDLIAAVPFYGSQPATADVPKIKAALMLHYGSLDSRINAGIPAFEAALKAASIEYVIYMYEGAEHAFFNDTRPDRYHKEAAELAWQRTIAFFNEKLRGAASIDPGKAGSQNIPTVLNIIGNFPNPFNPFTSIEFSLGTDGFVTLDIYNISGQKINTLLAKNLTRGVHTVIWNGKDANHSAVSTGSYFCRLKMGNSIATHKMDLVR